MKFTAPSIESLLNNLAKTAKRFPLALLFALMGTFAAIQTTLLDFDEEKSHWVKLILCSNLGLVYSLAASTFITSRSWKRYWLNIFRLLIVALLALYYFTMPEISRPSVGYRFALLAILGHLLVSVAPFSSKKHINGFWQYNKTLFLRFLASALYSAVLFAGLAVAMLALDELFGFNIDDERYFQLWMIVAGIFNTCMFLAGVPEQPLSLDEDHSYPKSLKVFTQYVLIPLVSIYVLILLAYELKILINWELPRGWVSNLIIAFAIFGILSLLLIFPVRKQTENKWIGWYSKAFYWTVLPLLALLFLAIITRINDYGFTQERFFVLVSGIWLAFIAIYFIFSKQDNIKLIPASLIVVVALTVIIVQPITISSQQGRLRTILSENQLLENGKIIKPQKELSEDSRREITLITKYLYENQGKVALRPFFGEKLNRYNGKLSSYAFVDSLLTSLNIKPNYYSTGQRLGGQYVNIRIDKQFPISTSGFDYYIEDYYGAQRTVMLDSTNTISLLKKDGFTLEVQLNDSNTININLKPFLNKLASSYVDNQLSALKPENASLIAENEQLKIKVTVITLNGRVLEGKQLKKDGYSLNLAYLITLKN